MRAFNLRVQFRRLNCRACESALISQPGFETSSLSSHVLLEPPLLFSSDGFQRSIVKRGVKRQARHVQLVDGSNIQLLLRNQDFDIAPAQRSGQTRVEQGLRQNAPSHCKALYSAFTGAVATLNTRRHTQFDVRPSDGTKNQPLPSSLFQTRFRLLDSRVSFQRALQNSF